MADILSQEEIDGLLDIVVEDDDGDHSDYEPLDLLPKINLGDMNVKDQLSELESFQIKMINNLNNFQNSVDYRIKLESARTVSTLIKNISNSLQKQRALEMQEDVDFTSPKVRHGMMMLIETFVESLQDAGMDVHGIDMVKDVLQLKLMGFEEKLNKEMKGLSGSMLVDVKNPLIRQNLE